MTIKKLRIKKSQAGYEICYWRKESTYIGRGVMCTKKKRKNTYVLHKTYILVVPNFGTHKTPLQWLTWV